MPLYRYECETDMSVYEAYHEMKDAPPIGHRLRRHGKWYTRVVGNQEAAPMQDVHFASFQIPKDHPDAPKTRDAYGRPVFTSKREVERFESITKDKGSPWIHREL